MACLRNAHLGLLFTLTLLIAATSAMADDDRPGYSKVLRQNEDWSNFDPDHAATSDLFDPIKHINLNDDGSVWLSLGGDARVRFEYFNNFGFTNANDDDYFLFRLRNHADLHVGENLRFFVEGKSALATDRNLPGGQRTLDVDSLALQQAFADITFALDDMTVTLRPGRQALLFGKQRLVSPLDWSNTMRTWDGVSAMIQAGGWTVTPFYTQFVPVMKYDFNEADAQAVFFGVYATGKYNENHGLDLYFLGLDRDDPITFNGTTGSEERYTVGGRLFGKLADSPIDYDLEGAYQFGDVGSGDIDAFMIAAELGYGFPDSELKPRVFVGFDYASGDDAPGGDVETFNHLYPLGHAYHGYIDVIGRQNIIDLSAGVSMKLCEKSMVKLVAHHFELADNSDALYNAGGGVVRAGGLTSDREVGQEIDLTFTYQFDRHLSGLFGYSHFFAGDFISNTGTSNDIDFVYTGLQLTY